MKVGNYLKLKRIEKKFSLRQMAYKTGLSHTYISDIEKGKARGTLITQEKILNALQLNIEEKKNFYKNMVLEKLPLDIRCNMEQMENEINHLKKELGKYRTQLSLVNETNCKNELCKVINELNEKEKEKVLKFINDYIKN